MANIRFRSVKPDTPALLEIRGEHIKPTTQEVYIAAKDRETKAVLVMHANGWHRTLEAKSEDAGVYTDPAARGNVTFRLLEVAEAVA